MYDYDPELKDAAAARLAMRASLDDIASARAVERELCPSPAADHRVEVRDVAIGSKRGGPRARLYLPVGMAPLGWILNIHGGGFMLGGLHTDDERCQELTAQLGVGVLSVDYRLAPEHPYPAALEDCAAALAWLRDSRGAHGAPRAHIAVRGVSAGGGLAAGLALWERDHARNSLCFQFLGVPVLDDRMDTASMRQLDESAGWDRERAEISWRAYLSSSDADPYAAPARAPDLAGLPAAYVTAMEFDVLRDEAIEYASRLLRSGVSVELHVFRGTYHGSFLAPSSVSSRELAEELAVWRESPLLRREWFD